MCCVKARSMGTSSRERAIGPPPSMRQYSRAKEMLFPSQTIPPVARSWVGDWVTALRDTSHIDAPITRLGGPLIALVLLRWRRAEAWLVAALACVPQTPGPYEALPLFLVALTLRQSAVLAYLTYAVFFLAGAFQRDASVQAWMAACGRLEVFLLYLPCVVMVLRRPNEGALPTWLAWPAGRVRAVRAAAGRTA